MRAFFIIAAFLNIFFSGCSVCRFRQISKTESYGANKISYYRVNSKCPTNSNVEGYNKQGYLFYIHVFDSLRQQIVYQFYRDSVPVKKIVMAKNGKTFFYKLSYDSGFDYKLSALEHQSFKRLQYFSDSLGLKNLDYLSTATGFKLKSESGFKTRKRIR